MKTGERHMTRSKLKATRRLTLKALAVLGLALALMAACAPPPPPTTPKPSTLSCANQIPALMRAGEARLWGGANTNPRTH